VFLKSKVMAFFKLIFVSTFLSRFKLPEKLQSLSTILSADSWYEVYRKLYSNIIIAWKRPYSNKGWLDIAPQAYESLLLADHWCTVSILKSDDYAYEFAVMLDTCMIASKKDLIRDGFLNIFKSPLFANRQRLEKPFEWILPTFNDNSLYRFDEIPIDIFTSIENYTIFDNIHLELSKAFKETALSLIQKTHIGNNHPQISEIILFCIKNNFTQNGLEEIIPTKARSTKYLNQRLLPDILAITDSYFRARALIRFLPYAQDKTIIFKAIKEGIYNILDPFEQSQLLLLAYPLNIFPVDEVSQMLKTNRDVTM
jgi:hypothetical protein